MKRCTRCGELKSLDEFYTHRKTVDGRQSECASCSRKRGREWRRSQPPGVHAASMAAWKANNPEKYDAIRFRVRMKRYGLTPERYYQMLADQDYRCAACGSSDAGADHGIFGIDHDHSCCPERKRSCGKCVRGLLCNGCNSALGHAKDDVDRLAKLISYLDRWRQS